MRKTRPFERGILRYIKKHVLNKWIHCNTAHNDAKEKKVIQEITCQCILRYSNSNTSEPREAAQKHDKTNLKKLATAVVVAIKWPETISFL